MFAATLKENIHLLEISLILSLVASWIAYRQNFYQLAPTSSDSNKMPFWQLLNVFLIFFSLMLFIVPLITFLWLSFEKGIWVNPGKIEAHSTTHSWLNAMAILLSSCGILGYTTLLQREMRKMVWGEKGFLNVSRTVKDMGMGMLTWFICYPIVLAVNQLFIIGEEFLGISIPHDEQVAVKLLKMAIDHPVLLSIMGLLMVTAVPLVEELLFRGFLQNWLKGRLGRKKALILAALIFSLFHFSMSQGFYNFQLLLSLFILGCYLGFLFERQQSLWAPIALHATFNAISILAIVFQ